MNNHKIIILATTFFLLISFIFLSIAEKKEANINSTNVWMIYFENPKDQSLNFKIENHSDQASFHWQVLSGKNVISQSDVQIEKGKTASIPVSVSDTTKKKITISVTTNDGKKEIYKNL